MKINKLTVTGPDDKVDQSKLVELSQEFPFIEWGILFSKTKSGDLRYPSQEWIDKLVGNNLTLSAHFCGWWPKQVLEEKNYTLIDELHSDFKRVQLNYNFKNSTGYKLLALLDYTRTNSQRSIILQVNKSNQPTIGDLLRESLTSNLHFLYDASGGRGTQIERIDATIGNQYTGYAGGLNPNNIDRVCQLITDDAESVDTWIDLETGVRNEKDEFDLDKVRQVAEIVNKFI